MAKRCVGAWRGLVVRLGALALLARPVVGQVPAVDSVRGATADAIRSAVAAMPADERARARNLYQRAGFDALWSTSGVPTVQARELIVFLDSIAQRGLRPADYAVDSIRMLAAALSRPDTPNEDAIAKYDVILSRAALRLLDHLHSGRVDPEAMSFDLPPRRDEIDLATAVLAASRSANVARGITSVEPVYAQYGALLELLARYRALAVTAIRPPVFTTRVLRPGGSYADAAALRQLLVALGDIPKGSVPRLDEDTTRYSGDLVEGVVAFQRRHGLEADSVIGPLTMAQLRVPMVQRVRQIEWTLERWRWLPARVPSRLVIVNVPEFHFRLYENDPTAQSPELVMKVIVGQAQGRHHTPVFTATMDEVIFRPYWDVPLRIARRELLPIIRRKPGYLTSERMDIVRGGERDAVLYPPTATNLARVESGTLRLRQRPGPNNALGLLKFVFPNRYDVYMHGTPTQQLFDRARRDFSHGCIRVEDPAAMAEVILHGEEGWDRAAIEDSMQGDRTLHVPLARPLSVYVFYATVVAERDGTAHFYDDIYGHDTALARVLETHRLPARVALITSCPAVTE